MIVASDPEIFDPVGRRLVGQKILNDHRTKAEGDGLRHCLRSNANEEDVASALVGGITLAEQRNHEKVRFGRVSEDLEDGGGYEELWMGERVATLARQPTGFLLRKFSTDYPLIDGFWHRFETDSERMSLGLGIVAGGAGSQADWDTLCFLGKHNLDVHEVNGRHFTTALPFEVESAWPTKYGILLQRVLASQETEVMLSPDEPVVPLLYAMSHPLNEVLPVLVRPLEAGHRQSARYAADSCMQIVFSSRDPPLVLSFQKHQGIHVLWTAKKASPEDALQAAQRLEHSICSMTSAEGSLMGTPASRGFPTPSASTTDTHTTSHGSGRRETSSSGIGTTQSSSQPSGVSGLTQSSSQSPFPSLMTTPGVQTRSHAAAAAHLQSPCGIVSPAVSRLLGLSRLQQQPSSVHSSSSQSSFHSKQETPHLKKTSRHGSGLFIQNKWTIK